MMKWQVIFRVLMHHTAGINWRNPSMILGQMKTSEIVGIHYLRRYSRSKFQRMSFDVIAAQCPLDACNH